MAGAYQIQEYGSFVPGKTVDGCITLPEHTFDQLEQFVLSNRGRDADALELMGLSARRGVGRIITAKNYIGLITMNDGTAIEILPKICSDSDGSVKKLVVDMLRTLRDAPFKSIQTSHVDVDKLSLLELFIRMFLDEVFVIAKRGLKSSYEAMRSNETMVKGKIAFPEHIRRNYAHRERVFLEYDAYTVNRPENRLIKAALLTLRRRTASVRNRTDLKTLLNVFSEVDASTDYEGDFSRCAPERNMQDYETALRWCRVFLTRKSFTSFSGPEVAFALLFPMETLFESYVAAKLRKTLPAGEYRISVQERRYHLFDQPDRRFLLRPDLVITRQSDNAVFVADTKWKLLSDARPNYGISQADMYQMYAYQKKYGAQSVTLLFPRTDAVAAGQKIEYRSCDGAAVRVCFVDLFRVSDSLGAIASAWR